jgi:UDP-N-acetylglucosamine 2-epimerase (non-hydrolysing)
MKVDIEKKKIVIVVGTRPNFIKITQFEKEFKQFGGSFEYVLIHTGQHFDEKMSSVFFEQLKLKKPDYNLGINGENREDKIQKTILELEQVLAKEKPVLVVVAGDVDSTYAAATAAKKLGLKLAHLESGLRSFDLSMPEEVNRLAVDKISDLFFVTEKSGLENLKNEGVDDQKVHFVGNTMIDTLAFFDEEIRKNTILNELNLTAKDYILMTMHRPQNVDNEDNLKLIIQLILKVSKNHKVVIPVHPRTLGKIKSFGFETELKSNKNLHLLGPLDYFAFQNLILNSALVLTDSGGIQEETTYRQVPCLTVRPNTERPSTIEIGTNELIQLDSNLIEEKIETIFEGKWKKGKVPPLWDGKATKRIVEVLESLVH